ncbi:MAG TPA: hypothetical protein VGJ20_08050 [Xanthobacteraceae bacterium]
MVALSFGAFLSGEYDLRQRPFAFFELLLWFSGPGSKQSQQSTMLPPGAPKRLVQLFLGLCQLGMQAFDFSLKRSTLDRGLHHPVCINW